VARMNDQGNMDPNFNGDGIYVLEPASNAPLFLQDLAQAPNGDLVAVGSASSGGDRSWRVVRLLAQNGSPDPAFAVDGIKTININLVGNAADLATSVAIAGNGSIMVGGV